MMVAYICSKAVPFSPMSGKPSEVGSGAPLPLRYEGFVSAALNDALSVSELFCTLRQLPPNESEWLPLLQLNVSSIELTGTFTIKLRV